jgi:hypothetical protein
MSWDNPMSLEMRGHWPCPGTCPGHFHLSGGKKAVESFLMFNVAYAGEKKQERMMGFANPKLFALVR